jgi:hypothetical protein
MTPSLPWSAAAAGLAGNHPRADGGNKRRQDERAWRVRAGGSSIAISPFRRQLREPAPNFAQ